MIERYQRPEMAKIWHDENRFKMWTRVERAVCEHYARTRVIPAREWKVLKKKLAAIESRGLLPAEIAKVELTTKHDVLAYTTVLARKIGPTSRYVHYGLTSSDVVDTGLMLLIQMAGKEIVADVDGLLAVLKALADRYQDLPAIGRTHGMFAEPTAFGLRFLSFFAEWARNRERLARSLEDLRVGKLSGAVGANSHLSCADEARVLASLGLKAEPVSTQVIPRDRIADLFGVFAVMAGSLERIALELRHLQRSEVSEVSEGFSRGQKGSSAMPHKKNPISSENMTGLARLVRGYSSAAFENVALWHERDISHSSVERVILPDTTIILDYALRRMTHVLLNLQVATDRVQSNLDAAGPRVFSGHLLLKLVQRGFPREQAYEWIQAAAFKTVTEGLTFEAALLLEPKLSNVLTLSELKKLCRVDHALRNVGGIYARASRVAQKNKRIN